MTPDGVRVGARLLDFRRSWRGASRWVRRVISKGAVWHWVQDPPPTKIPHFRKPDYSLTPLIDRFVAQGAVEEVSTQPCFTSHLFTVPKPSGERRLIINLSQLNLYIRAVSFKMSNHNSFRRILPRGSFMATIDIRDAYLHVPVDPAYRKFLAFTQGTRLFFFKVLPFGLSTAPYIFSRVLSHPLEILRREGIGILGYLDDLILWAPSALALEANVRRTTSLLQGLGFVLNWEKSSLLPTQDTVWLGVRWLSQDHSCGLSQEFIAKLREFASSLLSGTLSTLRKLESFLGLVAFAAQIIPAGKLRSHRLARAIGGIARSDRDISLPIPTDLYPLLPWWTVEDNLQALSPLLPPPPTLRVWTDASDHGFGAYTDRGQVLQATWSEEQSLLHINVKELLAVALTLEGTIIPRGESVLIVSDNSATVWCIKNQGSNKSPRMQEVAERIALTLSSKDITIRAIHLAGSRNVIADALSREGPASTEWELPPQEFARVCTLLNLYPELDAMATPINAKCQRFISPFPHPSAVGTDFFVSDLNQWSTIYVFPPPNLILRVLSHLSLFRGQCLLITPCWPNRPWFPILSGRAKGQTTLRSRPFQKIGHRIFTLPDKTFSTWTAWSL